MGSDLIVVSAPILQLFAGIGKAHEPVGVQAFRPELAVKRLDEPIVGRLARPREVERDVVGIGPEIEVPGDELAAVVRCPAVDTQYRREGGRIVFGYPPPAQTFSNVCTTSSPRYENRGSTAGQNRECVSTMVRIRSFLPIASWS